MFKTCADIIDLNTPIDAQVKIGQKARLLGEENVGLIIKTAPKSFVIGWSRVKQLRCMNAKRGSLDWLTKIELEI